MDAMLEGADASQLNEWTAYSLLRPFGHTDRLLTMILCKLINMMRGANEQGVDIDDFLPIYKPDDEQSRIREALAKIENGALKNG